MNLPKQVRNVKWTAEFTDRGATVRISRPTYPRLAVAKEKMVEQYKAKLLRVFQEGGES